MGNPHPKTDRKRAIENILETKSRYFWDKGPLDPKQDNYIIIERLLEFGTEDEVVVIQDYYGIEAIKAVVKESRVLSSKTVNYFSWLFGISRGETKCFSGASRRTWQPY